MTTPGEEFLSIFVDYLMPVLRPYETTLYLYLYRRTHGRGQESVRVGVRTISADCGVGTRSASGGNIQHIREVLAALEAKGCIRIGYRTREGTLYIVREPAEIESVKERLATPTAPVEPEDYYRDPALSLARIHRRNPEKWRR